MTSVRVFECSSVRVWLAGAALLACVGCTSFTPLRTATFVDENGRYAEVEYGHEEHVSEFVAPNGAKLPFKTKLKVRVTTPAGDTFVAYQNMSPVGVLYKTDDAEWEFFEEGTACAIAKQHDNGDGYRLLFQGLRCKSKEMPREKKGTSKSGASTPQGFGRPSSGPPDSSGPRTVEQD